MTPLALPFDVHEEFPHLATGRVYLNHAGCSLLPQRSVKAIGEYLQHITGVGEGNGRFRGFWPRLQALRRKLATMMHAGEDEIAFIKSTTHGLMLVSHGLRWNPGDRVIVEERCFPANWYSWTWLQERHGVEVAIWPERDRRYELEDLERLLAEKPARLVSVTAVDYATGFRHDLDAIGRLVKEAGALYCVDAIQFLGAFPVDLSKTCIDFLSADSHKWLLGPESIGVFYCRRGQLASLGEGFVGWLGREGLLDYDRKDHPPDPGARRFEMGAPNYLGTHGFEGAVDLITETGWDVIVPRIRANVLALEDGLQAQGWSIQSPRDQAHASGIVAATHGEINIEQVARALNNAGHTCSVRREMLRLAPHFYQSPEDMERVFAVIANSS